jgi:serine/threonine protein kinase
LKICDFGSASFFKKNVFFNEIVGTENYIPPEVLKGKKYDGVKMDIWSLGVILYTMLTGCFAFDDEDRGKLIQKMEKMEIKFPNWIDLEARDLIEMILVVDPKKRPTIEEIRNHKFCQ